jgi:2,3-bisphosphoglycerate-independent phosphoglycerate mutase
MVQNRVILVVRDGWGYSEETKGNAVLMAYTPNNDQYLKEYPWTTLKCTGNAVGLPEGTQGGSEPGHLTMGAGRVIWQPLEEINRAIRSGSFYKKKQFKDMVEYLKSTGGRLHLGGLLSDQGIHGTTEHLYALLELAKRNGIEEVFIHCFLDGRDVPERSAKGFLKNLLKVIEEKGVGKIASLIGRYYAMDRDTNWDRTQMAYDLLTLGEGKPESDPFEALEKQYQANPDLTDYYVEPVALTENGKPVATVQDGDAFILWNFRSDRARQITYALTQQSFDGFVCRFIPDIHYVCMSVYDQNIDLPVVFPQKQVEDNLGITLSRNGAKQLRIAETEKYAHITFFFNSQIEEPYPGEDRILVPSPKVPNYADRPAMSARGINQQLIPAISKEDYDFILVNYANGDLVGHSANMDAGIKAVEVVDRCLGEVVNTGLEHGYTVIVTGDHGNIETFFYPDGSVNPSHGFNPVPFIIISDKTRHIDLKLRENEGLSSVSPTVLELMEIIKPEKMTSPSLIH